MPPLWTPEPDDQGRLFDGYVAVIRRVSDGLTRFYHANNCRWDAGSWYWWANGNATCDCNRAMFFDWAGGGNGSEGPECGEGAYQVLEFRFPNNTLLAGPDAAA